MGGADYKSIAPEKSFIDVNDFSSVKQLAQFLIKLSKNKVIRLKLAFKVLCKKKFLNWVENYIL